MVRDADFHSGFGKTTTFGSIWAVPAFKGFDPRKRENYILIDENCPVSGITRSE
jgi:hypothetical protein